VKPRRQLPVYSPVTLDATVAGAVAAMRGDPHGLGAARVSELIRTRYRARDVLLTDSGTSALRLAIEGAVGATDCPVALPGYGCYDLASAAEGAGSRVGLYDVDPRTLGPDWTSLESLRRFRPAAVVVAHWFGALADVRRAGELLPEAVLIEDSAQGVGGSLHGRPLGSFGSLSVLSFGRGKGTTGGAGGALLAHDDRGQEIVSWARGQLGAASRGIGSLIALVGQWAVGRPALYGIPASLPFLHLGETIYHPPRPPRGATAASLAVLAKIWWESDREIRTRKANAARLTRAVADSPFVSLVAAIPSGEPGYLRLPVILREGAATGWLAEGSALGVARGYPQPLSELPSLRARAAAIEPLPGAAALAARLLTLPTHRFLQERDLSRLEAWLLAR
jgi:perosamine synthetase